MHIEVQPLERNGQTMVPRFVCRAFAQLLEQPLKLLLCLSGPFGPGQDIGPLKTASA